MTTATTIRAAGSRIRRRETIYYVHIYLTYVPYPYAARGFDPFINKFSNFHTRATSNIKKVYTKKKKITTHMTILFICTICIYSVYCRGI